MWVGVLGALEVRDEKRTIVVPGKMRSTLLAALICRAPRIVPAHQLIDDLWGPTPPPSADKTLQSHLVRLRHDLAPFGTACILTSGPGYRIDLTNVDVDALRFSDAIDRARQSRHLSEPTDTVDLIDEALRWWRGDAYADLPDNPFLVAERTRLQELRLCAQEWRTDAAMAAGESSSLIDELQHRVAAHPLRERPWEQLILVLYRSGRQVDALAAYRQVHALLSEELGVEPGPALQSLQRKVLGHDHSLLDPRVTSTTRSVPRCPYRGLDGYQPDDAAVFFGRENLVSTVVARLAKPGVVVMTGASGSGKSSLLRAGVVPSMRLAAIPGSRAWRTIVTTPCRMVSLDDMDLLILDQAEELFTELGETAAQAVVEAVRAIVAHGGRVVLAVRGDYFARLVEHPFLADWAERGPVLVGALRDRDLQRVIVEPAALAGVTVDAATVDAVLDEAAGQPQPLPLLSVALVHAWERRTGDRIDLAAYRSGGGVAGAIQAAAERCYGAMSEEQQRATRRLLVRLSRRNRRGWTGRTLALPSDASTREVVGILAANRLVTASDHSVAPAHDALLDHWPRLRDWLDDNAAAAESLRHLAAATDAWRAAGSPTTDLYRGARLQTVLDWRADHPDDLTADESAFVEASARSAEAELTEVTARADREWHGRRRLRRVVIALVATLLATVAATTVAVSARSAADGAADRARASALTADAARLAAASLAAPDTVSAAQLAVAGYRLHDSDDSRGALLSALLRSPSATYRVLLPERPISMVASPSGDRIYLYEINQTIQVIDPARRSVVETYPAESQHLVGVIDGGRELVVNGWANGEDFDGHGRVTVLNALSGAVERTVSMSAMLVGAIPSISRDGRWLVTVNKADRLGSVPTDQVVIQDTEDWTRPARTVALGEPVLQIAASATAVAAETTDGRLYLIDPVTLRVKASVQRTDLPDQAVVDGVSSFGPALAIDPAGKYLGYASPSGDVDVLSLATPGAAARAVPARGRTVQALAFSGDGSRLAVGFADGGVTVADTANPSATESLTGHTGGVRGAVWSNGRLLTDAGDSTVIGWQTSTTSPLLTTGHSTVSNVVTMGRFGDIVVGILGNDGLYTRDLRTGRRTRLSVPIAAEDFVTWPDLGADGRTLAVSVIGGTGQDQRVIGYDVWDLGSATRLASIPTSGTGPAVVLPDERGLLTATDNGTYEVLSLPGGAVRRSFRVPFAGPRSDRLDIQPMAVTPAGDVLVEGVDPGPSRTTTVGNTGDQAISAEEQSPTDDRLGLIDPESGRLLGQASLGAIYDISTVGWSHDWSTLAVGTIDGTVETFDAHTLAVLHRPVVVTGGYVQSVDFSPDRRMLVVGGADGALSFWSTDTLTRLGPPIRSVGNPSASWWAWFTPAGEVTGLMPTQAIFDGPQPNDSQDFAFPGQPEEWLGQACRLAGGPMTSTQWASEIPDRPYPQLC